MAHVLNASMIDGTVATSKPSFFRRLVDAMIESRYQSAIREIRRHQTAINSLSAHNGETGSDILPFRSAADK
jgi:hypothetical protein